MCNGQPYVHEQVQLWEPKTRGFKKKFQPNSEFPVGDELWDDMPTGQDGRFQIFSHGYDFTLLNIPLLGFGFHPYLWIPNYCETELKNGNRCTRNIVKIWIPEGYINPCQPDVYVFDIGTIDMATAEGNHFNWAMKLLGQDKLCRSF
uniref:Plastocyanin-like domain-containing protein n=1 Tax=Caenorhabditis tropicalis TaxID=1561998 RepID=A0A1I7V2V1_9PELO